MKSTFVRLAAAAMLGISGMAAIAAPVLAEDVKITVLGVGDIYAFDGGKVRGGFARLNALAKAERAANPNTLYVLDGDMISPSLLSGIDKGANTIDLTNIVPFDLAVPGNHEFDFGPDIFLERLKQSKYPWAAINIAGPDGKPVEGLGSETVMKEFGGVKVALVPVGDDETPVLSSPGDWKFTPSVATALDAAQHAREAGADIVIAITHTDHEQDYAMQSAHKFDLIVSGHDHDLRMGYDGITAYVETSTEANYVPIVDLNITVTPADGDKKRTVTWTPNFRIIDTSTVAPDAETQAAVDKLATTLSAELDVQIGTIANEMSSVRAIVRGEESAWGNLITDAMKAATNSDVAIYSGGGIRGDKVYPAGTVLTRRDVFTEFPFGNKVVMATVNGADLLAALENGFSQVEKGSGRFPQVSGIKVSADLTKAPGARVVSVEVNGKPLDPAATYKLAMTNYMHDGGDGYTSVGNGDSIITEQGGGIDASTVVNYVTALGGKIDAKVEGRITLKK
ncbi:MAG: bifunctional UDP-sugar hydrolase/5'-nucleotidase [Devosia sp.]